jgi:hypothetical protein
MLQNSRPSIWEKVALFIFVNAMNGNRAKLVELLEELRHRIGM